MNPFRKRKQEQQRIRERCLAKGRAIYATFSEADKQMVVDGEGMVMPDAPFRKAVHELAAEFGRHQMIPNWLMIGVNQAAGV